MQGVQPLGCKGLDMGVKVTFPNEVVSICKLGADSPPYHHPPNLQVHRRACNEDVILKKIE